MSLHDWLNNGWLRPHQTSSKEISTLLKIIDRDLIDCKNEHISENWRFKIAYSSARKCCIIPLYCLGYKISRGGSEHYRVIQSLVLTMGPEMEKIKDYLDNSRSKRNVDEYKGMGIFSEKEVNELIEITKDLFIRVKIWLKENFPQYL